MSTKQENRETLEGSIESWMARHHHICTRITAVASDDGVWLDRPCQPGRWMRDDEMAAFEEWRAHTQGRRT